MLPQVTSAVLVLGYFHDSTSQLQVLHAAARRCVLRAAGGGEDPAREGGRGQRDRLQEHDAAQTRHQVN